eukprot:CAMPEP_0183509192 /NCGR_PEP_ID=MMETSP0371-20130417/9420_1 /TAXON_ID=268820 /ORGANISM="Peridinium aciculiferum, Strain PAER-2" /LENGTH=95 /DNA_ID=CAMNT_0025705747 /DNA_START=446 /DNA_END=730 /DNA_ORIENTATION=-
MAVVLQAIAERASSGGGGVHGEGGGEAVDVAVGRAEVRAEVPGQRRGIKAGHRRKCTKSDHANCCQAQLEKRGHRKGTSSLTEKNNQPSGRLVSG